MGQQVGSGTPVSRYREAMRRKPAPIGMLIEGDSWFAFPMLLRTNVVSELKSGFQSQIAQLDLSGNGDEAREMLCGAQYSRLFQTMARERLSFDCVLFSGGGNDIVGDNLPSLLNRFEAGMTWEDCLSLTRFNRRLQQIESAYRDLSDLRDDHQPGAWVFTHSYDYAIPSGKGVRILGLSVASGWVKDVMDSLGIPSSLQRTILDQMLARFDDLMLKLEQELPQWKHVRTQGTLSESDWEDELHPTTVGFRKVTDRFSAALRETFPDRLH